MTSCPRSTAIQDLLDGDLPESEARVLREHTASCVRCAAEFASYSRMFRVLDVPVAYAPAPDLTQRVLDHVLPSRVRHRWVATVGWSYAAAFAACVSGAAVMLSRADVRTLVAGWSGELSSRLIHAGAFVLNTVAFAVVHLASGWGMISALGQRLAPLGRALGILLSYPGVQVSLVMAAAAVAGVLWWMRPRDKSSNEEVRHVGVVVF